MKRHYYVLAVAFAAFVGLGVTNITSHKQQIKLKDVQLQSKSAELNKLQLDFKTLNVNLEQEVQQKDVNQERVKQLEAEKQQLEQRQKELEAQVQARAAEKKRLASVSTTSKVYAATMPVQSSGGNCATWKAQAGIPDTNATNKLIDKESGCRPNAVNPTSGACGIPQAYPCSKLPCPLNDSGAVCQLKWMQAYVVSRYGSWDNALAKWYSRCGSSQGCWY